MSTPPISSDTSPSKSIGRWGTISGAASSPIAPPSSNVSVRRNHTIHGARHHDKPRLEKHFEQPETLEQLYAASSATSAIGLTDADLPNYSHSLSSSNDPALSSPSTRSDFADDAFSGGLAPLQALYSKATVSRNNSLPTRNSSRRKSSPSPSSLAHSSGVAFRLSLLTPLPPTFSVFPVASHLSPHATQGRSSLFNSLSAITGGTDHDEHEWEKMIGVGGALGEEVSRNRDSSPLLSVRVQMITLQPRKGSSGAAARYPPTRNSHADPNRWLISFHPIPHQGKDNEEHLSLSSPAESPWSDSAFAHRHGRQGPSSAQPHSPIVGGDLLLDGRHRSGSSNTQEALEQGPFASSTIGSGLIRRHQSLNHHSGRAAAQRLSSRSSDLLQGEMVGHTPSSSISSQIEHAFSPRHSATLSAASSPVVPSGYSKAPWNQPSTSQAIGSPSRFAANFPSDPRSPEFGREMLHSANPSHDSSSPSLMDIHANMAKLDIRSSLQHVRQDSTEDSSDSITPTAATSMHSSLPPRPGLASRNSANEVATQSNVRKLPSLITNRDVLARGAANNGGISGPVSASAYVPPIGHAHSRHQSTESPARSRFENDFAMRMGPFSAAPAPGWADKEFVAGGASHVSVGHEHLMRTAEQWGLGLTPAPGGGNMGLDNAHMNTLALSLALAQEQQRTAMMQAHANMGSGGGNSDDAGLYGMRQADASNSIAALNRQLRGGPVPGPGFLPPGLGFGGAGAPMPSSSPGLAQTGSGIGPAPISQVPGKGEAGDAAARLDVATLILQKGYNPAPGTFNLNPPAARFFVIKSYTEDDVHKSLKYEIWASTDKGNQRLDKAFRESASTGPIYLFFSVNASGHFCGMAQMLTPLDYTTSSNVWAQDGKWKGTFKVRWIYVKDLPNNQLRHIRLTNTPEVKPVTQSRDTQELTGEAGREVLRIMAEYPAKTSLLQDFDFYELQSRQGKVAQSPPAVGIARDTKAARPAGTNGYGSGTSATPVRQARQQGSGGSTGSPAPKQLPMSSTTTTTTTTAPSPAIAAAQNAGLGPSAL